MTTTRLRNLTGQTFGRLRVLRLGEPHIGANGKTYHRWVCLCDPKLGGCGKEAIIQSQSLRGEQTRSCGCLSSELAAARVHIARDANTHHWTPAEDALLGTAPDREIAQRLGVNPVTVFRRRKHLGLPPHRTHAP